MRSRGRALRIVEWGVLHGDSIQWLHQQFPDAEIHAVDIVFEKPEWPKAPQIKYHQIDQGDAQAVKAFYGSVEPPDLIIEDGSHLPRHQSDGLCLGFRRLSRGGVYILEDIHTAYCKIIASTRMLRHRILGRLGLRRFCTVELNSLALLLALEHIRECGLDLQANLPELTRNSHFMSEDVAYISEQTANGFLFHRTQLPLKCWRCSRPNFDYHTLRCQCGADVFAVADSMSYVLTKR